MLGFGTHPQRSHNVDANILKSKGTWNLKHFWPQAFQIRDTPLVLSNMGYMQHYYFSKIWNILDSKTHLNQQVFNKEILGLHCCRNHLSAVRYPPGDRARTATQAAHSAGLLWPASHFSGQGGIQTTTAVAVPPTKPRNGISSEFPGTGSHRDCRGLVT